MVKEYVDAGWDADTLIKAAEITANKSRQRAAKLEIRKRYKALNSVLNVGNNTNKKPKSKNKRSQNPMKDIL